MPRLFTVNLAERSGNRLLVDRIDALPGAFDYVRVRLPFRMDAVVILPDPLHCLWTLPPGDSNFSTRWGLINGHFSRAIEKGERVSQSREAGVNAGYGSADSGNTWCAMTTTAPGRSITSIGIR